MIRKLITLFKLGRKIAKSDILSIASKFKKPPLILIVLFKILSFSFQKKEEHNLDKDEGERLSRSLESMGTTFIKLGQFLATRPDIIGEELSKKLDVPITIGISTDKACDPNNLYGYSKLIMEKMFMEANNEKNKYWNGNLCAFTKVINSV